MFLGSDQPPKIDPLRLVFPFKKGNGLIAFLVNRWTQQQKDQIIPRSMASGGIPGKNPEAFSSSSRLPGSWFRSPKASMSCASGETMVFLVSQ